MPSIIRSRNYKTVIPDYLEVLIDNNKQRGPVIGLKVDTAGGSFIVPIVYEAAKDLSECILRTLLSVAPELFY